MLTKANPANKALAEEVVEGFTEQAPFETT